MSDAAPLPKIPRPAATVVLARDASPSGLEIYFVERHRSIGFMGGMHVFPGGKVAPGDSSDRMRARVAGRIEDSRHALWGDDLAPEQALARAAAAVRETFEEAGVLLASKDAPADLAPARARLHAGAELASVLEELGLWLEPTLLEPWSRWITPESEPVRFDTSFYIARLPANQDAEHDANESVAGFWLTPTQALEAARSGTVRLAPPTARTLESLQDAGSVDAVLTLARSRPPPRVLPIIRALANEVTIFYPGDPEHPDKTPGFEGPTRHVMRRL
jgi:8-oxo-dGTP pyrophosphatase MutT (NUDIX family)